MHPNAQHSYLIHLLKILGIYTLVIIFGMVIQTQWFPEMALKIHFLIAFIHFLGLVSIGLGGFFKKDIIGFLYLAFMIVKMGAFLVLFYQFPEMKTYLIGSILLYLVYLFVETALVIKMIHFVNKSQQKS